MEAPPGTFYSLLLHLVASIYNGHSGSIRLCILLKLVNAVVFFHLPSVAIYSHLWFRIG